MSGNVYLVDLLTGSVAETQLVPDVYLYMGAASGVFVLHSYHLGLVGLSMDGSYTVLYSRGYADVVGSRYAAGVQGDYLTLLPLQGGDAVMVPSGVYGETFVDAYGTGLLSRSQHYDKPDVLQYYDTISMTVRQISVGAMVVDADLYEDHAVVITRADYGQVLEFSFIDFSMCEPQAIHKLAYDSGILSGQKPLPAPSGSDEMVALIEYYEQEYGLRILYESDIFDLEPLGYQVTPASEKDVYEKALLLEQLLQFLPAGIIKEIGEQFPVVIYLCQEVQPTAGGMNTLLDGYNVTFLSVTGYEDYFLNVAAHEIGHALERGMDGETLSMWRELMPQEVQKAYHQTSLTVEYTPDDKDRTPVWFVDAYARTSEMEDRAVLFATMFEAWRRGDNDYLQFEGLRLKADCWSEMLRRTYACCADVTFSWENG